MPSIKIDCPKANTPFGEIFYPGLNVGVLLPNKGYQAFEFIVDSGADCTVVPRDMATLVGIKLPRQADEYLTGVSGKSMACYKGKLSLKIQNQKFDVQCLFTRSNKTPLLLGRVDFFSIFQVLFDGNDCSMLFTR